MNFRNGSKKTKNLFIAGVRQDLPLLYVGNLRM